MGRSQTVFDNILIPRGPGVRLLVAMEGEFHWENYTHYWACHKTYSLEVNNKRVEVTEKQAWDLLKASGFLDIPIWDCPTTASGTINCRF